MSSLVLPPESQQLRDSFFSLFWFIPPYLLEASPCVELLRINKKKYCLSLRFAILKNEAGEKWKRNVYTFLNTVLGA